MKETEKAYLAGIVDGEGCIGIFNVRGSYSLRLSVGMTDTQAIELLSSVTGKRISSVTVRRPNCKVGYLVRLSGVDAQAFLNEILPYLRVKKNLAELAIQFPIVSVRPLPPEIKKLQSILFEIFKVFNKKGTTKVELNI